MCLRRFRLIEDKQPWQPHDIINELRKSYAMELETVQNYLANAIDLDGVRAEEIKEALLRDIEEELSHARKVGNRIKVLEGRVPVRSIWTVRSASCSRRRTARM